MQIRHLLQHTAIPRSTSTSKHLQARFLTRTRALSTLPSNPHIYIHASPSSSSGNNLQQNQEAIYTLSFSPHAPSPTTAIGHSSTNPPTPGTFHANSRFTHLLHETLARHAHADPSIQAAAVAFAATNVGPGAGVGVGNVMPSGSAGLRRNQDARKRNRSTTGNSGIKGEEDGDEARAEYIGFMHVADERNPAVYGRIPEPEDIFGTLQVGPLGRFVDGHGAYQESGTYRVLTREGCLGLSDFLRQRLLERLAEEEEKERASK